MNFFQDQSTPEPATHIRNVGFQSERSTAGLARVPDGGLGPVRGDVREQLARWGQSALADDWLL